MHAQALQQLKASYEMLQAQEMQDLNAKLLARAQDVEQKHGLMMEQFAQMSACLKQKTRENECLQSELERLKSTITVRHFAFKSSKGFFPRWPAIVLQDQKGTL